VQFLNISSSCFMLFILSLWLVPKFVNSFFFVSFLRGVMNENWVIVHNQFISYLENIRQSVCLLWISEWKRLMEIGLAVPEVTHIVVRPSYRALLQATQNNPTLPLPRQYMAMECKIEQLSAVLGNLRTSCACAKELWLRGRDGQ
jgi:hypothetical protein